jgi:hypothetical protein
MAGGAAGSTAGVGGSTTDGAAGGATDDGGAAGAGGAGGQAPPPPPPPVTATTTVILIDDVIVGLPGGADAAAGSDGAVSDGAADGGVASDAADGGDAASVDAAADSGTDGGSADGATSDASDAAVVKPDQSVKYTFDTSIQMWKFTIYGSTPIGNAAGNLAGTSTLAFDATHDADLKTTSGSLKGTVPFLHESDQIDFQAFSQATGKYDWTGFVLTVKVKVLSGGNLNANCPLTAVLYVSDSNAYKTTLSGSVNLLTGADWVTVTYDMANAGVDVTQITQMGLQINTGAGCTAAPPATDGGTDAATDGGSDAATDGGSDAATDGGSDAGTDAAADVASGQ